MKLYRLLGTGTTMTGGALLVAAGFNLLLIPHQLASGGISGVAMIIGYLLKSNIAWLYLALNLPILIWGWIVLGRNIIYWSVYTVIATTIALQFIPVYKLADDVLLCAVFGGAIIGLGSGMALRLGGSSGGFDIIATIVTRTRQVPIGTLIFLLNGLVIIALGLVTRDWDHAMYSMLSMFIAGKVVDQLHIRQIKVTAFIITSHSKELLQALLSLKRGVTILKTNGAYTAHERDMLMTVTTRYELPQLRKIITSLDPKAFVNVVETVGVMGDFRKG